MHALPRLFSYRRCPYAIRARLALWQAGVAVQVQEVSLRDKPAELLSLSPKGTVPVLWLPDGTVLEQSLDIMRWALAQHDPEGWLHAAPMDEMLALIARNDGPFKQMLDRYKYAERHPERSAADWRDEAVRTHLADLETRLHSQPCLFGHNWSLADMALLPFVRQFAQVDRVWFDAAPALPALRAWLQRGLDLPLFATVMAKPTHQPAPG
jgi:UPF0176 protein